MSNRVDERVIVLNGLASQTIRVPARSSVAVWGVFTAGKAERATLEVILDGEEAAVSVVGAILGHADDQLPFDVVIEHRATGTRSRVALRSVLEGKSSGDTVGRIHITQSALRADAFFSHHALLLGQGSRAHALPILEIEQSDVKAGHAVTVGRIEDETLLYCATRGIPELQATRLIAEGFLATDAMLLPAGPAREEFCEHVRRGWAKTQVP